MNILPRLTLKISPAYDIHPFFICKSVLVVAMNKKDKNQLPFLFAGSKKMKYVRSYLRKVYASKNKCMYVCSFTLNTTLHKNSRVRMNELPHKLYPVL